MRPFFTIVFLLMEGDCSRYTRRPVLPLWPELLPVEDVANAKGVLAVIAFGESTENALTTIAVQQLDGQHLAEVWRTSDSVRRGASEAITYDATDHVLIGTLGREACDVERTGAWAFDQIIEFARTSGYPHLLRVWNHVGDINVMDGETERYRAFCVGRHESFARHGYALRTDLPAASAVGMRGRDYRCYFIASKEAGTQVENPRQVSAYDYPPQYGRRSPSFSRATVLRREGQSLVFIAGTASIVGHETKHAGDVGLQTDETVRNIARVLKEAGAGLGDLVTAKAYVRRAEDQPVVAERLGATLGQTPVLYVCADVCRADLLVEVEGVARLSV
jgi:chorismate lyase/3-hydroxybenzoate synthase